MGILLAPELIDRQNLLDPRSIQGRGNLAPTGFGSYRGEVSSPDPESFVSQPGPKDSQDSYSTSDFQSTGNTPFFMKPAG